MNGSRSSGSQALSRLIRRFPSLRAAVIGDLIVDEYVYGRTARVSREAPVLILRYQDTQATLGGAGNTAHNVACLGAKVVPIGVVGLDPAGESLTRRMKALGMDVSCLVRTRNIRTITKTRILAGGLHTSVQQVIRIDREPEPGLPAPLERFIFRALERVWKRVDVVIVSDYGYGVVGEAVTAWLNQKTRGRGPLVFVDAQKDLLRFRHCAAVTPNEPEVEEALDVKLRTRDDVVLAGRALIEKCGHRCVVITRGRKGMVVVEQDRRPVFLDIYGTDEVADVTGAGDTVVATLGLAVAAGGSWADSAKLANMAAGIVVTKSGTVPITIQELRKATGARLSSGPVPSAKN